MSITTNGFLDQFDIPDIAREQLKKQNLQAQQLEDGVSRFMSGHDRGVPFRFFVHAEYNANKSKLAKYKVYDEYDMIEWIVDARVKPTERVHMLPEELLQFETEIVYEDIVNPRTGAIIKEDRVGRLKYGECIGGKYREAYIRFKEGLATPGMPLAQWNVLPHHLVASLASDGVHTVEQFAALARNRVVSRYPQEIIDAFDQAVTEVSSRAGREYADKQVQKVTDDLMRLAAESSKKDDVIAQLQIQMKMQQEQLNRILENGGVTESGIIVGSQAVNQRVSAQDVMTEGVVRKRVVKTTATDKPLIEAFDDAVAPKRRGRPKGSKNRAKDFGLITGDDE